MSMRRTSIGVLLILALAPLQTARADGAPDTLHLEVVAGGEDLQIELELSISAGTSDTFIHGSAFSGYPAASVSVTHLGGPASGRRISVAFGDLQQQVSLVPTQGEQWRYRLSARARGFPEGEIITFLFGVPTRSMSIESLVVEGDAAHTVRALHGAGDIKVDDARPDSELAVLAGPIAGGLSLVELDSPVPLVTGVAYTDCASRCGYYRYPPSGEEAYTSASFEPPGTWRARTTGALHAAGPAGPWRFEWLGTLAHNGAVGWQDVDAPEPIAFGYLPATGLRIGDRTL